MYNNRLDNALKSILISHNYHNQPTKQTQCGMNEVWFLFILDTMVFVYFRHNEDGKHQKNQNYIK